MNQAGSHMIRKASVNFQYNGNTDGLAIRQEVSEWCRNILGPSFGSILAEYDLIEDVILIDRISLDIDLGRTDDWKKELTENIINQLKEKIHSKISLKEGDVIVESVSASFSDTLLYYLKFGFLPWHANFITRDDFETELESWVKKASSPEIKNLLQILPDDKSVRRLVSLLSQQEFETLMAAAIDETGAKIASFFDEAKFIIEIIIKDKSLQESLLRDIKERVVAGFQTKQPAGLLQSIFAEWLYGIGEKYPSWFIKVELMASINPEIQNIIRQIQHKIIKKSTLNRGIISDRQEKTRPGSDKKAAVTENELNKELSEGVFISNAGTVIIAPFLTTLYTRAGILTDNMITDESTALSLVHYSTSGLTNPAEFELLLPKILCGIDPVAVMEILPLTNDKLINEADDMLASVIEYWKVLKDTSADGLREAFLQRNGKLSLVENEWLLIVEQKPYDMLLEQLPWNINMIKLPWMKNIIRTQWF